MTYSKNALYKAGYLQGGGGCGLASKLTPGASGLLICGGYCVDNF